MLCLIVLGTLALATAGAAAEGITESGVNTSYNSISSRLQSVTREAQTRISQLYDIDAQSLQEYISEANALLSRLDQIKRQISTATDKSGLLKEFNDCYDALSLLCDKILVCSAESKVVSARSTWHRPCENTYSDIERSVKIFKDSGINLVFVETFYHGYSVFKTDIKDIPYYPTLASSYTDTKRGITYDDYLSAFVACCKENGIEVHAWVENFYVGISGATPILQNHPDWIVYNDDGSIFQRKEGGAYIFIDPANIEVQNLLIDYYNDLFEKNPDVLGLNLDYIRYPVSNQSMDTGFTKAAMVGFYESIGREFEDRYMNDLGKMTNKFLQLFNADYLYGGTTEANENYQKWVQYRTDIITDYVRRIKSEVKDKNGIVLSTAVFASLSESVNTKKADWQSWFNNGWIDIATPMAYYYSASSVESNVKNMITLGGNNCLYYTGLASSYSGLPAWQNKEFIEASYDAGAQGFVIFSSAQILGSTDVQGALKGGVGAGQGVLPHSDVKKILEVSFADILDKADRLYIPAEGMTVEQRDMLESTFDEIMAMCGSSAYEIHTVTQRISTMIKSQMVYFATGDARQRIKDQLSYLVDILDARLSMQLMAEGLWNPEDGSERPTPTEPLIPEPEEPIPEPEEPDVELPVEPETPEENNTPTEPELNLFQRIWQAILAFFRRLFGREI